MGLDIKFTMITSDFEQVTMGECYLIRQRKVGIQNNGPW